MTTAVTQTANAVATTQTKSGFSSLGSADFIKLMTAQMQQQDPFNPVDNKEMLAQLAQFSSLSEISDVNKGVGSVSTGVSDLNANIAALGTKLDAILAAQQAAAQHGASPAATTSTGTTAA